jgi:hypothetical protein
LAGSKILLEFEQIYGLIFGSQIELLKKLNEVVGQGLKMEDVISQYEHVRELFKDILGKWSIEQYMTFLFNRLLVTVDGDTCHITNLGVEYLTWMTRNGRSENKPL